MVTGKSLKTAAEKLFRDDLVKINLYYIVNH